MKPAVEYFAREQSWHKQSLPKSEKSLSSSVIGKAVETVNYAGRDKMEPFLN